MEMEEDGQLPFLDVLVKRNGEKLSTTVFRKKTHTDRYIKYGSNHHPMIKSGVINCLKTRMDRICDKEYQPMEEEHLVEAFMKNGYPKKSSIGSNEEEEQQPRE